jgi:hypothetical protein
VLLEASTPFIERLPAEVVPVGRAADACGASGANHDRPPP